ncbi:glycosyltransferase [Neokomagataea thailandica]|uniref:Glycosyltransferase n=1 Tax=Neokomagataea tanensis NBRC 106556 TaxID=1223519 RepID=A0ABQ0QKE7_9PROT|nr:MULTISPECIES: glycosyltransferase [Neokomagataea]GBR47915.1 glycosyltransferase [Neokomagataea tanensis NBRC 106556]
MLPKIFQKFFSTSSSTQHLLFVDCDFPRPQHDAGSVETLAILDSLLSLGFTISFLALGRFFQSPKERNNAPDFPLTSRGIQCLSPSGSSPPTGDSGIQESLSALPMISTCIIARSCCGGLVFTPLKSRFTKAKFIFLPHDLHFLREEREVITSPQAAQTLTPQNTKKNEIQLLQDCDASLFFSQHEVALAKTLAPKARIQYIPLTRPTPTPTTLTNRRDIGFIGNFSHRPNADAMAFFLADIWPSLHAQHPDVILHIIGENPPADLSEAHSPHLKIHGHLPDLGTVLSTLRLTIAPLRFGAGAKGKVVSSLAAGIPCVMTEIAAEGMSFSPALTQHCIAKNTEDFQHLCSSLLTRDVLWHEISQEGLSTISTHHSPDVLRATLAQLLRSLNLPTRP